MYDPNNPQQPGDFSITSHMGAGPKPFDAYAQQQGQPQRAMQGGPMAALQGQNPMMQGGNGWRDAFKQARTDWRDTRPMQGDMSQMDWRSALMGWRDLQPDRRMFQQGQQPQIAPQPTNPAIPPMSQPINGQLPLNPYGG